MVLRPAAVRERLLKLEEVISRLEELGRLEPEALRRNFRAAWAAERGLQLGAEILFDVGNHILSAHFGISAQDYEDIIAQLGASGVIDPSLRDRLKGLGAHPLFGFCRCGAPVAGEGVRVTRAARLYGCGRAGMPGRRALGASCGSLTHAARRSAMSFVHA